MEGVVKAEKTNMKDMEAQYLKSIFLHKRLLRKSSMSPHKSKQRKEEEEEDEEKGKGKM